MTIYSTLMKHKVSPGIGRMWSPPQWSHPSWKNSSMWESLAGRHQYLGDSARWGRWIWGGSGRWASWGCSTTSGCVSWLWAAGSWRRRVMRWMCWGCSMKSCSGCCKMGKEQRSHGVLYQPYRCVQMNVPLSNFNKILFMKNSYWHFLVIEDMPRQWLQSNQILDLRLSKVFIELLAILCQYIFISNGTGI